MWIGFAKLFETKTSADKKLFVQTLRQVIYPVDTIAAAAAAAEMFPDAAAAAAAPQSSTL